MDNDEDDYQDTINKRCRAATAAELCDEALRQPNSGFAAAMRTCIRKRLKAFFKRYPEAEGYYHDLEGDCYTHAYRLLPQLCRPETKIPVAYLTTCLNHLLQNNWYQWRAQLLGASLSTSERYHAAGTSLLRREELYDRHAAATSLHSEAGTVNLDCAAGREYDFILNWVCIADTGPRKSRAKRTKQNRRIVELRVQGYMNREIGEDDDVQLDHTTVSDRLKSIEQKYYESGRWKRPAPCPLSLVGGAHRPREAADANRC